MDVLLIKMVKDNFDYHNNDNNNDFENVYVYVYVYDNGCISMIHSNLKTSYIIIIYFIF
jgi:hypothetical protein